MYNFKTIITLIKAKMTDFGEQEINTDIYQGASFREIILTFNRNPLPQGVGDWFNHQKYNLEVLPKLR
jgi:hypothetical protein